MTHKIENEELPEWKVTMEDMGLPPFDMEEESRGGTDLGSALAESIKEIEKSQPTVQKTVFVTANVNNENTVDALNFDGIPKSEGTESVSERIKSVNSQLSNKQDKPQLGKP